VLLSVLGVTQGSVTPLAVVNDPKKSVIVLLDAVLEKAEFINVHPLTNTATVQVTPAELKKFLAATGHELKIVDLAAIASEAPAAGGDKPAAAKAAKPAKEAAKAAPKGKDASASSSSSGNLQGIQAKKDTDFHNWFENMRAQWKRCSSGHAHTQPHTKCSPHFVSASFSPGILKS
jgi:ribosomal protein L12E/L44/L45/RPP1/RPP2